MATIAYIDESGDHNLTNIIPQSPVLTIAAVILKEEDKLHFAQRFRTLKKNHFGSDQVILHSRDIRKQEKEFLCLRDPKKRQNFYKDFNELVTSTDCTIISITIHKERHVQRYCLPINPYQLALEFIIERITHWSRNFHSYGPVELIAESRGKKEDKQLKEAFDYFRSAGTRYEKSGPIQQVCQSLHLEKKAMNIPGLQLADMFAYPLARHAIGKADPRTMEVIKPKLYGGTTRNIESYGAIVFPP